MKVASGTLSLPGGKFFVVEFSFYSQLPDLKMYFSSSGLAHHPRYLHPSARELSKLPPTHRWVPTNYEFLIKLTALSKR